MTISAKDIQAKLAISLERADLFWMPNVYFAGGECDFLSLSLHGYATEYEVKVSTSDWYADQKKDKWEHEDRNAITYFDYCIPEHLQDKIPSFVPETCGILVFKEVTYDGRQIVMREIRKATRNKQSRKVTQEERLVLLKKAWYRYKKIFIKERSNGKHDNSEGSSGGRKEQSGKHVQ